MNNHFETMEMRENLQKALMQCYDLLIAKMQGDLYHEGKIIRLAVALGATEDNEPLQVILELNLQPQTFHPMHSIVTLNKLPFDSRLPHKTVNPQYAIAIEDLLSLKLD